MGWLSVIFRGFLWWRRSSDGENRIDAEFRRRFGIRFRDPTLLRIALTHRSHQGADGALVSNERLEFLGDAVLDVIASDHLFRSMSAADEGDLTKARSRIVNKNALGRIGLGLGILDLLLFARDEIRGDERALATLSADALEAVIGAIYLDRGFRSAYEFVIDKVVGGAGAASSVQADIDYKSQLQELCQARFKVHPDYRIVKRLGPEHRKVFHVEVRIRGETYGFGTGRSRKEAEQVAAGQAMKNLTHPSS